MRNKKLTFILSLLVFSYMLICGTNIVSDVNTIEDDLGNNLLISSLEDTHILEWNFTWGGNYHDSAYAINYDSLGNVYIAGITNYTFTGNVDLFLAKFNSSGHFQWNQTWGEGGYIEVWDIAIDSLNNIYLSGCIEIGFGFTKLLLVKYDNLGNYQWNSTWGGSSMDYYSRMALDSSDNIYLTGRINNYEIYLEKYSKRDIPSNGEPSGNNISFGSIYLMFTLFGIAFLITITKRSKKL